MSSKPRILHCCPTSGPLGGIWTYIRHIKDSRLAEQYYFDVCFYPGPSVGVSARVIRELGKQVRSFSPDLVHLHGLQTEGFNCMMGAVLGGGSRRLLTVHGFIEDSKFRSQWRRQVIARILEPMTLLCADGVFAVSNYGAAKPVMHRWARGNLGSINNALPLHSTVNDAESVIIRKQWGWSASEVVVICVARLSREKGLLDLVDAFADVAPHHPALRLLLVGDGPDANLIRDRLQYWITSGHAVIHPATPNVAPLLGASDIFVLPSLHENQSFAILEAMSSGLPVLSTRVGGTPELVTNGETGLLIPPLRPALLAEAMGQLAGDPALRKRLGLAGKQSIATHHSFEDFIKQVGAVYHRMLGA